MPLVLMSKGLDDEAPIFVQTLIVDSFCCPFSF
jgi:hypothetical protein